MDVSKEAPGAPRAAPYGQSCAQCFRAKCKCMVRPGGSCERCHRLGKECTSSTPARRRGPRPPMAKNRRSHLEDKLDDLVALLRAQQPAASTNAVPATGTAHQLPIHQARPSAPDGFPSSSTDDSPPISGHSDNTSQGPSPSTTTTPSSSSANPTTDDPLDPPTASSEDDEARLHEFRTSFIAPFPYMHIPPTTPASTLRQSRPLTWSLIHLLTLPSEALKAQRASSLRARFAQLVFVDGHRSMDLLQALLTFLTWSYVFQNGRPLMVALCGVTQAVAFDVRALAPWREEGCDGEGFVKPANFPRGVVKVRGDEDRRAVLACYVVSAAVSSKARGEPMRWTGTMEDAVVKLTASPECPDDLVLVAIARVVRVAEDTVALAREKGEGVTALAISPFHIKALCAALDQVKSSLAPEIANHTAVVSFLTCTEVFIYELAIPVPSPSPTSTRPPLSPWQIPFLHSCLQAAKANQENFLTVPPANYLRLALPLMLQFSHAIQALYRLTILADPLWDRRAVRTDVDVVRNLGEFSRRIASEKERRAGRGDLGGLPAEETIFMKGLESIGKTMAVWRPLVEGQGGGDEAGEGVADGAGAAEVQEVPMMDWTTDLFDESLFTDMFAGWEG